MHIAPIDRWVARSAWWATPLLPGWALFSAVHPRLRADWSERWGTRVAPVEPGAVWIVASSVGEVTAAAALLPHLEGPVLLTADTDTGAAAARRAVRPYPRAVAAARPVDHPWILAPLWAEARPRAVIFVEGAWWPTLAHRAARAGVPILGVQGRPGRAARWAWLSARWRRGFAAIVARDATARAALVHGGHRIEAVGDLKADAALPPPPLAGLEGAIVGVSTHDPRVERVLVDASHAVAPTRPIVIAPRHPARFAACVESLRATGLQVVRRSTVREALPEHAQVLVLDSLGELAGVLGVAAVALIGATFDPAIGGHSPAEAARGGARVIAGPFVHSDTSAFDACDAIRVGDLASSTASDLQRAIRQALDRPAPPLPASGAGARAVAALRPWLSGPPSPECSPRPWAAPLVPAFTLARIARDGLPMRPVRLDATVIAIGSSNARGAGKTAAAAWAARVWSARGERVGVVVRGYGRARLGGPRRGTFLSDQHPDARFLGDDGLRLAMGAPSPTPPPLVAAGPDRRAGAVALIARGCTVVLIEDGLGERRLVHDLRLAVIDVARPDARGPLPAGERRGPRLPAHLDAMLLVGPDDLAQVVADALPDPLRARWAHLRALPGPWMRGTRAEAPPRRAVAVLGIGAPGAALTAIRSDVEVVRVEHFTDHAPIDRRVRELLRDGEVVVTTAKDAARLPSDLRDAVSWRDVELHGSWPL